MFDRPEPGTGAPDRDNSPPAMAVHRVRNRGRLRHNTAALERAGSVNVRALLRKRFGTLKLTSLKAL